MESPALSCSKGSTILLYCIMYHQYPGVSKKISDIKSGRLWYGAGTDPGKLVVSLRLSINESKDDPTEVVVVCPLCVRETDP